MAKIVAIRNPKSGRSRLAKSWEQIKADLQSRLGPIEFWETQGPGRATQLAKQAVGQGFQTVIAIGGDGTITQTANGLIGSDVAFGVIPSGTGNDLCRTLGIGASIPRALDALQNGKTIQMDVGHWRTDQNEGYFLNIAGMGFDAAVADRINQGFRSLRGTVAYLAAVIATLRTYQPKELKLTLDGQTIEEEIMLAAVANAQSYGGGMRVAPMASITDGMLDIILVKRLGKFDFLRAFPSVFKGGHIGHPAVEHYRARSIRLDPRGDSPFLIDGELTPCQWAEIEILPAALRIIVP
ncbi:MAG: diacylglycerol kinase family lipid kinase [Chlorobia bacterium]|nr:diacylglycerol kinase family lipid kinase [Fimbriimonadaceae bacterium]